MKVEHKNDYSFAIILTGIIVGSILITVMF